MEKAEGKEKGEENVWRGLRGRERREREVSL